MPDSLVRADQLASVAHRFRMLSEPVRLELLNLLHENGEMTVGELVDRTDHRQANVSKHLGLMADDGLLRRRRDGVHAYYQIADSTLPAVCLLVSTQLEAERATE